MAACARLDSCPQGINNGRLFKVFKPSVSQKFCGI
jgi:hypothetical protein